LFVENAGDQLLLPTLAGVWGSYTYP
jgi:hypothetical protein